jgi:putative transposase
MTENGDPNENAIASRVNGILKDEFGLSEQLNNINEAMHQQLKASGSITTADRI